MRTRPWYLILFALFATLGATPRLITETDLYAFHWLADPRIAPDGSQVVYTLVSVNARHDGYETALWIVSTQGGTPRRLTSGPHDAQARWSPDGKRLAFRRTREKDGKPQTANLYILSMQGGEARAVTDLPKDTDDAVWSPDGKRIAFTSTSLAKDFAKDLKQDEKSDVRVINHIEYRNNSGGYVDFERPAHIWAADVAAVVDGPVKPRPITAGPFNESDIVWSRDGSHIYFLSDHAFEPVSRRRMAVYSVNADGGDGATVARVDGAVSNLSISPAGNQIAFVAALDGTPIRSYSQPDLFITGAEPGAAARNLTANYDYDVDEGVGGDQHPPRGGSATRPFWSPDGRYLYIRAAEQGRANLKRIDMQSGKLEAVTDGDHEIYAYSATPDASKVAVAISTPTNIGDLYLLDTKTRQLTTLTRINEELFSQLNLTQPEMVPYKSFDGRTIQAWVQRPSGFDAAKKYPLILNIHGGPHAAYGYTFDHEFHWMAAKGYIVLYPNPRGSTTYGQEFGNIIQFHYPGDDFKDLMAGVDDLIARGWVDRDRMGVTGGSGGGLLTNWVVGHTGVFKAAVSQRSIADWRGFWYTADFAQFQPSWFRGAPWEDEADYKERSPITYIDKIRTPLLLIEGEADLRTPSGAGGEQMFRGLKYRKIPTAMVQFPGETHELSRSGKPTHRVERLRHIVAWFDKYLNGA